MTQYTIIDKEFKFVGRVLARDTISAILTFKRSLSVDSPLKDAVLYAHT